jgi:RecA-family ATPase
MNKTFADMSDTESRTEIAKQRLELKKGKKEPSAILKTFTDIAPEKIKWLWRDHIAIGKLTIYAGDPCLGKSQGTLDLAARLSTGRDFPDGTECMIGDTIILTSEDDPGDTIRPRLDALGADVSRISVIKGERAPDGSSKPMNLLKVNTFLDAIWQVRSKGHDFLLLIIDPLDGFLDGGDGNCNEEVRAALDGICELAEKEEFAIVGIKHLNKGKGDAAYRVGGSIAWTAKARSVWVFTEDKETGRRLFLPQKNNLAPPGGGFQYSIQQKDTGGIIAPYIQWEGQADDKLQEVLNPPAWGNKERAPEQEAVLQVLKEAGRVMKTGDIAAALGKKEQAVSNILGRLKAKGEVTSPVYGQWGIEGLSHFSKEVTHLHTYTPDIPRVTESETYTHNAGDVKPCNRVSVKVEQGEELDIY